MGTQKPSFSHSVSWVSKLYSPQNNMHMMKMQGGEHLQLSRLGLINLSDSQSLFMKTEDTIPSHVVGKMKQDTMESTRIMPKPTDCQQIKFSSSFLSVVPFPLIHQPCHSLTMAPSAGQDRECCLCRKETQTQNSSIYSCKQD